MKKIIRKKREDEKFTEELICLKNNTCNRDKELWYICRSCQVIYGPEDFVIQKTRQLTNDTSIVCPKCKENIYSGSEQYFESEFKFEK